VNLPKTIRFLGTGAASLVAGFALWLVLVGIVFFGGRRLGYFLGPESQIAWGWGEPILATFIGVCLFCSSWVVASRSWALHGRWASPVVYLTYIFPVTVDEAMESGVDGMFIITAILGVLVGAFLCFYGGVLGDRRRVARRTKALGPRIEDNQRIHTDA